MKFLYITPEHVSGTLSLFKKEHERRGDECRFVTFWHSRYDFEDDICLNLPLMPNLGWVRGLRASLGRDPHRAFSPSADSLPVWNPGTLTKSFFRFRDFLNWPQIEDAVRQHHLDEFDIIQLDSGLDFTRDARFAASCAQKGAHLLCFYHGSDLRCRGIIPEVDALVSLRLTSEWDLLEYDSRLEYLFLPFETTAWPDREFSPRKPLKICHAARNPLKGTAYVIAAVEQLQKEFDIELVLMTDLPHRLALQVKSECDLFIDQLTNEGGWGYGMSSVEALAMGLPVITNIPRQMETGISPHPFIQAEPGNLHEILRKTLQDTSRLNAVIKDGQTWVRERHDVVKVVDRLYSLYEREGWLTKK
ncbi:glycosyltransferase [bacterium]|nr:glycosyltransferase [bacterium]MBU1638797.1 glycosyltransferase [bacterium]MBU1919722.1 glycosyltransferase [bacterium]